MDKLAFGDLSGVSDDELLRDLRELLAGSARAEVRVVAHLAEVEERRLHLKAACSSLFDYCQRRLGFSESEAFHRITAARLARKFPVIFELLEARAIHLSALRILRDHLTRENHRELRAAASGKSKKEVEQQVAALSPRPDVASQLRKLPAPRHAPLQPSDPAAVAAPAHESGLGPGLEPGSANGVLPVDGSVPGSKGVDSQPLGQRQRDETETFGLSGSREFGTEGIAGALGLGGAGHPARSPASARAFEPHSSTRYALRVSVSHGFKEKLERARDLMSHANPSGELGPVLERALDALLERLEKQRFAQTKRPRTTPNATTPNATTPNAARQCAEASAGATPDSEFPLLERRNGSASPEPESQRTPRAAARTSHEHREHIPNEVRRAVAARDGFRCTYVDDEGRRCPSCAFLQLHHEQAHALGGPSTLDNLRLLCGPHNRLLAERDFGRAHQEQFIKRMQQAKVELAFRVPDSSASV